MWWTILAAVTLALVLMTVVQLTLGNRQIQRLCEQDPAGIEQWPSVSIIVAARDEQAHISSALESLIRLDYPDYELIVVNDRSTDRTGAILDQLVVQHPQLAVLHLDQLPPGWLGKNHAQWYGAEDARGDYLLFTDADVAMEPMTLRHAMSYALREQADHLAASPGPVMPTLFLQSFVVLFVDLFAIFTRPWKVADPNSRAHIGIGAFNLVRTKVYQAVGTHRTIAMRPDDDIKLGKIIKSQEYRQRFVTATNMIRVPWYASVRELVSGMEKNAFSGVDYRISLVLAATVIQLLISCWPFLAVWLLSGPARYLYALTVAVLLGRSLRTALALQQSPWCVPLFPLTVVMLIFIQWRAMLLTYINDGIRWRGTHYSLAELRANKI